MHRLTPSPQFLAPAICHTAPAPLRRAAASFNASTPYRTHTFASPRLSADVNLEFRLTKHATLFANVRNLTDIAWRSEVHSPATPCYARITNAVEFGPQAILGVKGTF